jgi:hypothetical protein
MSWAQWEQWIEKGDVGEVDEAFSEEARTLWEVEVFDPDPTPPFFSMKTPWAVDLLDDHDRGPGVMLSATSPPLPEDEDFVLEEVPFSPPARVDRWEAWAADLKLQAYRSDKAVMDRVMEQAAIRVRSIVL